MTQHLCKLKISRRRKQSLYIILTLIVFTIFVVWKNFFMNKSSQLPTLYIITATYSRPVQRAELLRLCYTLMHVPRLHWIIVEDAHSVSDLVKSTVEECGLQHTLLAVMTPPEQKLQPGEPYWSKAKGVEQRNLGLKWLRRNTHPEEHSVVYIADDDNVYSLRVFQEMRHTRVVSTWLVGLSGEMPWEGCVSDKEGQQVIGFRTAFRPERPFPIDMAGFAFNLRLLHQHPDAGLKFGLPLGFQESHLLLGLGVTSKEQLEPRAACRKILVWHTRTAEPLLAIWRRHKAAGATLPPIDDFVVDL